MIDYYERAQEQRKQRQNVFEKKNQQKNEYIVCLCDASLAIRSTRKESKSQFTKFNSTQSLLHLFDFVCLQFQLFVFFFAL